MRSPSDGSLPTCGGQTARLHFICDELPPGTYSWTVRSIGLEHRQSEPSEPRVFVKVGRITEAPTLLTPDSGATFSYPQDPAMLRWTEVDHAARYTLSISSDPTFPDEPDPWLYRGQPGTTAFAPAAEPGTTMYWRVRGTSEPPGSIGPWSEVRSYVVRWTERPRLRSPAPGASVSSVAMTWDPVPGARGYIVEASRDPAFAVTDFLGYPEQPMDDWPETPAPATYYWRVRAINIEGALSGWSTTRTFTVDPLAPASPAPVPIPLVAPTLLEPADGITNFVPNRDFLRWSLVDGTIGYELQVVPVSQDWYESVGQPTHSGRPIVPLVDAATTYKWRVRANATQSLLTVGPWSEERTFTTAPRGVVTLTAPSNGAVVGAEDVLFEWKSVARNPDYWIDLSATADFANPISTRTYATPKGFPGTPGTWFWRVRAGRDNTTAISGVRTVTIVDDTPPVGTVGYPQTYTLADTITLEGPAHDAFSWVVRTAVSADGQSWTEYDYGAQPTWSLTSAEHGGPVPGLREIWMRWKDEAGNWSAPARHVFWYGYPDPTPPVGAVLIEGGAASVSSPYVTVDVAATDTDPVSRVALSNDGSTWVTRTYAPSMRWTLSEGDGAKTVWAKWQDVGGNWSDARSDTIVLRTVLTTTYTPIVPTRLLDTRTGNGLSGRFAANEPRTLRVAGRLGIPADAVAITGNLTVVGQTEAGYVSLTTSATSSPKTSTLNFPKGDVRANNVTIALKADGTLSAVYKSSTGRSTDLILDVTGYFRPYDLGATYHPLTPARLLDSRSGNGVSGTFSSGVARTFTVAGRGGVPAGAVAVTGNLTIVGQDGAGYASLAPSFASMPPATSTINAPVGDVRANGVTVALSATGKLSAVYVSGGVGSGRTAHLVFDVTGYYTKGLSGFRFVPITAVRALDTRTGTGLTGAFGASTWRTLGLRGTSGIPASAGGITGNLTEVGATAAGYVTMSSVSGGTPTTSTINFPIGDVRANGVTGALSGSGAVSFRYSAASGAKTHLVLDVTGYFR